MMDAVMANANVGRDCDSTWTGMTDLAQAIAEQGIVVLMVGLPDSPWLPDPELGPAGKLNCWPAIDYARFLSAAIDHLCTVAPERSVSVDTEHVGLVGHSMGGAGVLCAAAKDCKDKVAACVALNPGGPSNPNAFDALQGCAKYATGALHSGEYGEGTIEHLADIRVPTFIYGSQAEYNAEIVGPGYATIWPVAPCQFEQVGASTKELYVDNLIDNPGTRAGKAGTFAHVWMYGKESVRTYGDGKPLSAVCSFLRRHLAGSSEPVMARPDNAKEWRVVGARTTVLDDPWV